MLMTRNIQRIPISLQSLNDFAWGPICPISNYRPEKHAHLYFGKDKKQRYESLCP